MTFWKLNLTIFIISCRHLLHCNCQIHLCIRSFQVHTRISLACGTYKLVVGFNSLLVLAFKYEYVCKYFIPAWIYMCVCVCSGHEKEKIRENNFEFRLWLKSWCNHTAPQELNELPLICIPGYYNGIVIIFHSITEYSYDIIADTSYYNRTWYYDCVAYI